MVDLAQWMTWAWCLWIARVVAEAQCDSADETCTANFPTEPKTISVVLPCAGEGEFAQQTVKSVFENTPKDVLKEIIVVDDGSSPPLGDKFITKDIQDKYKTVLLRHERTEGLIRAKHDGGNAATGDVVVFFDCHVAPQKDWHKGFLSRIRENYKRIVVPRITDLDIDTWKERPTGAAAGLSQCYLTWDIDFKWFDPPRGSADHRVPVVSGGLLGLSRQWWNETGGYDDGMSGWGGENVEQSLRTWLCGGEIVSAMEIRVAHMWRTPDDPRTQAAYRVQAHDPSRNKARAAMSWYDGFSDKLSVFPQYQHYSKMKAAPGEPWYGKLDKVREVQTRLQCKPFAWYLHHFSSVYEDGGLLPKKVFHLRNDKSKMCLSFRGMPGVSRTGNGEAILEKCAKGDDRQRWHGGNMDPMKGHKCCSSYRAWDTDQCLTHVRGGKMQTSVCDMSGEGNGRNQRWHLTADGTLEFGSGMNSRQRQCLASDAGSKLVMIDCALAAESGGIWKRGSSIEPLERKLYDEAVAAHPEWTK